MDNEKIKELTEKVTKGTATQEEELSLLKFLNKGFEELNSFVKSEVDKNNNVIKE